MGMVTVAIFSRSPSLPVASTRHCEYCTRSEWAARMAKGDKNGAINAASTMKAARNEHSETNCLLPAARQWHFKSPCPPFIRSTSITNGERRREHISLLMKCGDFRRCVGQRPIIIGGLTYGLLLLYEQVSNWRVRLDSILYRQTGNAAALIIGNNTSNKCSATRRSTSQWAGVGLVGRNQNRQSIRELTPPPYKDNYLLLMAVAGWLHTFILHTRTVRVQVRDIETYIDFRKTQLNSKHEQRATSNETRDKKITFTIPYAILCVSVYLPRYPFRIRGFQSLHPTAKS